MTPGNLPMAGDRRTAFIRTLALFGLNLTSAAFALQVRDRKDGGGLRADLTTVGSSASEGVRLIYGGTDTIANHVAAGRITTEEADGAGYETGDSVALSLIGIRINEATMEAIPVAAEVGDDTALWWDLHVTPSGGIKEVYLRGTFTVRAGVTE